jgi:hypothetical protein
MEHPRDFLEPGNYPRGNFSVSPSFPGELSPTAFPGANYVDNAPSASSKSQPLFPDMRRDEFLSKSTISTKDARTNNHVDNWSVSTSSMEHFRADQHRQKREKEKYYYDEPRRRAEHVRYSPKQTEAFTSHRVGRSMERTSSRQSLGDPAEDFRHDRSRERRIPDRPEDYKSVDSPTRQNRFQDHRRHSRVPNRKVEQSYNRFAMQNGEMTGSADRDDLIKDDSISSKFRRPQQMYDDDYQSGYDRIRTSYENDTQQDRYRRNVEERDNAMFPRSPLNERNERETYRVKTNPVREFALSKSPNHHESKHEESDMSRSFYDQRRETFQSNSPGRYHGVNEIRHRYQSYPGSSINTDLDDDRDIKQSLFDSRRDDIQQRNPARYYPPSDDRLRYQSYQNPGRDAFLQSSSRQIDDKDLYRGRVDSREHVEYPPPENSGMARDRHMNTVPIEGRNKIPIELDRRRPYRSPSRHNESSFEIENQSIQCSPRKHRFSMELSSRFQHERRNSFEERDQSWSPSRSRKQFPNVRRRNIYDCESYSENDDEVDAMRASRTTSRKRESSLGRGERYRNSDTEHSLSPGNSRRKSKHLYRKNNVDACDYSDNDVEVLPRRRTNSRYRGSSKERRERGVRIRSDVSNSNPRDIVSLSKSKIEHRERSRLRGKTNELSAKNINQKSRAFHFDLASMERGRKTYDDDAESNSSVSSLNVERGTSRYLDDNDSIHSKSQRTHEIELKLPRSRIKAPKPLEFVIDVGKVIDEDKEVTFSPSTDIPPLSPTSSVSQSQADHSRRIADATLLKEQSQARHQILKEIRQAMEMRAMTQDVADKKFWDRQVDSLNASLKSLWENHTSTTSSNTKPYDDFTAVNDASYKQESSKQDSSNVSGLEHHESTISDHEFASKQRTGHTVLNNYTTVKVQAPENLAPGHQFTVRINGKPHKAQVPPEGVRKGDIFSIRIPLNSPSTPENARSSIVKVRAPASLPEGYRFTAKMGDRTIVATVPKGGVQKGEIFSVRVQE